MKIAETSAGAIYLASAHKLPLPDKSVHCVTTSPPYFGRRRYHGEQDLVWIGGSYLPMTGATAPIVVPGPSTWEELAKCEHDFSREFHPPGFRGNDEKPGALQHAGNKNRDKLNGYQCAKCGACRCGYGSEESVEAYIWHSLLILRELRRVLRDDGVLWWNLGDSYAGSWGEHKEHHERSAPTISKAADRPVFDEGWTPLAGKTGIAPGNLIGVPHRLMLAAQADGWVVRNDAIWSKVSCMPESVSGLKWERHRIKAAKSKHPRSDEGNCPLQSHHPGQVPHRDGSFDKPYDTKWTECPGCEKCSPNGGYVLRSGGWRHTRSHEYVFQLTKSMDYWSDGEAVKEPAIHAGDDRKSRSKKEHKTHPQAERSGIREGNSNYDLSMKNPRNVLPVEPGDEGHLVRLLNWLQEAHPDVLEELQSDAQSPSTIMRPAPSNYTGNHFATFPLGLIRPLILSSTPRKCCPTCGKGWSPVVNKTVGESKEYPKTTPSHQARGGVGMPVGTVGKSGSGRVDPVVEISGYRQTCDCPPHEPAKGVVLDPFFGSGTTGVVAREVGVKFIGCDISREYLEGQAMDRALQITPAAKIDEMPLFSQGK